jgi:hypothetical protein
MIIVHFTRTNPPSGENTSTNKSTKEMNGGKKNSTSLTTIFKPGTAERKASAPLMDSALHYNHPNPQNHHAGSRASAPLMDSAAA